VSTCNNDICYFAVCNISVECEELGDESAAASTKCNKRDEHIQVAVLHYEVQLLAMNDYCKSGKLLTGTRGCTHTSYLSKRSQSVRLHDGQSPFRLVPHGVPQGSVLGPLLFILYTADIGHIAEKHGLSSHFYADDSQLYVTCRRGEEFKCAQRVLMRLLTGWYPIASC